MAIELTVILKDDERTYRHKFLEYKSFNMAPDDPTILERIKEAMEGLDREFEDIEIKTRLVVK